MHNDMNRQAQPNPLFRSACKKYQNYEHPLKTRTDFKEKYVDIWVDDFEIQTMFERQNHSRTFKLKQL